MPNPADLVLDPWTGLSHKSTLGAQGTDGPAPTWVGKTHRRRLTAYLLLQAYLSNAARYWLRTTLDDPGRWEQHREYGDPAMLVQTIRAAVLGGEPRPLVDGADEELPPPPTEEDIRDRVAPGPDGEDPDLESALTEARAEHDENRVRIDAAMERQEWMDGWWDDELASLKIIEAEDDSVGLGDGVYELVLSRDKERARLRVHEAGFYFPVFADDAQGDDYPERVHLAWEFEDDAEERWIRRITYERRRIVTLDDDGSPTGFGARRYPYAPDVASEWTVVKTDATWRMKDLDARQFGVDQLSLVKASIIAMDEDGNQILDLDLEIDFIPLVHVPNTSAMKNLWGESALTRIAQILDDLSLNDTDLSTASALVASPVLTMSGSAGAAGSTITTYGPGMVFRTGDGNMSVLDTSKSLDALIKMQDRLLERLSTVRQVPMSVLGRVDLNNQLAGITLLLSFGPFRQYIDDLRLVRRHKYSLLLRFVQRLSIVGGWLATPVLDANLAFGPFLPTDQSAVISVIVQLINAKVISRATGMRLAQEAGVPIDSIENELQAVEHEDFAGAVELANATGDEQAAADYLGIKITPVEPQGPTGDGSQPPVPGEPPAPGDQPPTPLP